MDKDRGGHFVSRLWWVVGALLLLLALLVTESVHTSLDQHEEQAVVETYSVARVLESDLAGLFDKAKLAAYIVATEQERRLAASSADDGALRTYIDNIETNLPDILGIRVLDASGRTVADGNGVPERKIESHGHAYFAMLRDRHASGIVISAPHREGALGPSVIEVACRIEHPDGQFAGAVVIPIAIERLVTMLAAGDTGRRGAVTLRGPDLAIIARHPAPAPTRTEPEAPAALRSLVERGEISGTFHLKSPLDGVERLYSYRRIAGYPLHITVGRATDEYLGHWRRDMGVVGLMAAVLFVVTLGATVMVDRAWRHQRRVGRTLETQAHTDALTGIANRRHFFEMAEAEFVRARRYDAPLSLLMLDIDHFKEVNDTHGHRVGDRVLQQLARTCQDVLRTVDVVGRVGGEEFAILLPETTLERAVEVAERLREAVARSEVVRSEGVPLRITVSIGVADVGGAANLDTLMSQSDTALYDAKHQGRNRVCAYSPGA